MAEKEGVLRMQPSGRWAVCRPAQEPLELTGRRQGNRSRPGWSIGTSAEVAAKTPPVLTTTSFAMVFALQLASRDSSNALRPIPARQFPAPR